MKIAALICAHHRPQNLSKLMSRLSGDLWHPLIHIDAKSDISQFAGGQVAKHTIPRRHPVYWGHVSVVEATLALMAAALKVPGVTHCYLMSGQCYPLKSNPQIREALSADQCRADWITIEPMPQPHKPLSRIRRIHFNATTSPTIRRASRIATLVLPRRDETKLLRGHRPYAGRNWWLLKRSSVERMLDFCDANRRYLDAFRYTHCPDEMFFQTLHKLLALGDNRPSPTGAIWVTGRSNPEIVTAANIADLRGSDILFGRKFDAYYPPAEIVVL